MFSVISFFIDFLVKIARIRVIRLDFKNTIMVNEYFEKLKRIIKDGTVVYIDAANLEQSVKDMWVNPKDIPLKSMMITSRTCRIARRTLT